MKINLNKSSKGGVRRSFASQMKSLSLPKYPNGSFYETLNVDQHSTMKEACENPH